MIKCLNIVRLPQFGLTSGGTNRSLRIRARRTYLGRWASVALLVLSQVGIDMCLQASAYANGLECPEARRGASPSLSQIERMTTGNDVDLANEIGGLIRQLKAETPAISNDEIANILIAAYCPVVAQTANASPAAKWHLMRQFDRVLLEQLAANAMPQGSLIVANVPLSPAVYQKLGSQARAVGQSAVNFMAAILTSAAGQ